MKMKTYDLRISERQLPLWKLAMGTLQGAIQANVINSPMSDITEAKVLDQMLNHLNQDVLNDLSD